MTKIIGIDPGSRITGYGVIEKQGNKLTYIASGCIRMTYTEIGQRLLQIFAGIEEIISSYQPDSSAIEQVFYHQYAGAALKLGQARGAAIVALGYHGLDVAEYSARQIKQAVVGYGASKKEQVQQMVKVLLQLSDVPQADAADALAVAICHAHSQASLMHFGGAKKISRGRLK